MKLEAVFYQVAWCCFFVPLRKDNTVCVQDPGDS